MTEPRQYTTLAGTFDELPNCNTCDYCDDETGFCKVGYTLAVMIPCATARRVTMYVGCASHSKHYPENMRVCDFDSTELIEELTKRGFKVVNDVGL